MIVQQVITQQPIPQAPWQPNTQLTQPSIPQQNAQLNQQIQALQQQIAQQQIVNDQQIKQSEQNLAAQYQSLMQQQQVENNLNKLKSTLILLVMPNGKSTFFIMR